MPIYEYQRADGTIFEVMQKASDSPLETCPETGQAVKRLISASAFHLKGGGWYKTDYAAPSSNGAASNGSSASGADSVTGSESASNGKETAANATATTAPSSGSPGSTGGVTKKGCGSTCGCH